MHPSPAKSLAGHRIKGSASFVVLPGSHIDQDKSVPPASNCIFSVSLRLNTARDDRIEQKDEEAAYGEPGISLLCHIGIRSCTLGRVALSYVELRPSGQPTGGSPEIQRAL
jgi:hypothetical protein